MNTLASYLRAVREAERKHAGTHTTRRVGFCPMRGWFVEAPNEPRGDSRFLLPVSGSAKRGERALRATERCWRTICAAYGIMVWD